MTNTVLAVVESNDGALILHCECVNGLPSGIAMKEGGLNDTAWCKLNNVKISTFFTRLKRIRESTLQNSKEVNCNTRIATASPFAEIDIANMRSAIIEQSI